MLYLRPYKKEDAKTIISWCRDEETFRKWTSDRYPSYPITEHFIMRYVGGDHQILRIGFVIVDDQKRGHGYGKAMIQLALEYAFRIAGARQVTIGVFENNEPAYHAG